ncbi:MAG: nickel-dependent hydrogenase large subunit [Deltaproteobacteria bacterium]|nr:nickel-dependent hydrogenase large subunit [Deltaproteobacteria bacterium]
MTRTINVEVLARVEGEGALTLVLDGEEVVDARLRLFEPPRLFEAMMQGRACTEAPDLTARICGICPVAYQMSACHAVEDALGVTVGGELRELRRLLYCGEWIESHVLHMVMLHAPDFFRVPDVTALAALHPERVRGALQVKKAGNAIVAALGGREIHPINVKVGGFYRAPRRAELVALLPDLRAALDEAEQLLDWTSTFAFPEFARDYELVSLRHPSEYPMNEGRLVSTKGLDIDVREFREYLREEQVPHSTALHAQIVGRGSYQCGPLARFVQNFDRLSSRAAAAAARVGLDPSCRNPFRMLLVRGVETIYALGEAIRVIEAYVPPTPAAVPLPMRAGVGHAVTEAPRGILYHRYELDDAGLVTHAQITPPTSQNQRGIEEDLRAMGPTLAKLSLEDATRHAEHAIRNYDPCISCSTHFLTLTIEQRRA